MILNLLFLMGVWIFKVWWVGVLSALLSMTLYIKTSYRVTVVVTSVISVVVWGALCFKEEVDVFFYPSGAVYGALRHLEMEKSLRCELVSNSAPIYIQIWRSSRKLSR